MNAITIQNIVSVYLKAGCIGWVTIWIIGVIRLRYVAFRKNQNGEKPDKNEMSDLVWDVTTERFNRDDGKRVTIDWPKTIIKLVIWPYGLWRVAMNYDELEQKVIAEIQKRENA